MIMACIPSIISGFHWLSDIYCFEMAKKVINNDCFYILQNQENTYIYSYGIMQIYDKYMINI